MLTIRSVIFNVLFYLNLVVILILALPTLAMPRRGILAVARFWARSNLWLLRTVCGTTAEFHGIEKIACGPLIVACLPVALNSGLFWPRRSLRRNPGTIRVEVLDPIPPGLDKDSFFKRLQHEIEAAATRLLKEGKSEQAALGLRMPDVRQ